jgi:tetratricopeptide (TPR) repeat protein
MPLGERRRILDYLREAETLAEALGDRCRLGQVSARMTEYFTAMGDHDRAIASGQQTLALAAELGDFALQVMANQRLGRAYLMLGDYRQATDILKRNVASLEGELRWERFGQLSPPSVLSRSWLVRCLAERGEFAEGIAHGESGLRIAEAVDQPYGLSHICQGVGMLYLRKGELHQAIPVLERSLVRCNVANAPDLYRINASLLGHTYALSGRVAEGVPLLEQAVELATSLGQVTPLNLTRLGECYLLAGRSEDTSDLAGRALALSRERNERGHQAWALRLLGEIAAHREPPDAEGAERHYREALALAEELGMRPLVAHCHCGLGILYAMLGRPEEARAELTAATELYRALEMTFRLTRAAAALVQSRGSPG